MPDITRRCYRGRNAITVLTVDPLVVEVGEPYRATVHRVVAAAIFVNARPGVVAGRRDICVDASTAPDDDLAARLGRPQLAPVEIVPIPPRHGAPADGDCAVEQQVDRHGRRP